MFDLLTMLKLHAADAVFTITKQKSYVARFTYHDAYNEQDVILRLYYDLSVNPLAAQQFASIVDGVPTVTLRELLIITSLIQGSTLRAKMVQL